MRRQVATEHRGQVRRHHPQRTQLNHVDKSTILTTQLFFDDATKSKIYAGTGTPYSDHAGWQNNVQNSSDSIYDESGLVTTAKSSDGYIGAVNLGV